MAGPERYQVHLVVSQTTLALYRTPLAVFRLELAVFRTTSLENEVSAEYCQLYLAYGKFLSVIYLIHFFQ